MAPTKTVAKRGRGKLPDDPEEFKATLGEHLEELRTRVFRVLGVLILAFTGAWYLEGPAYKYFNSVVNRNIHTSADHPVIEAFQNALDPFMLIFKLSGLMALIVTIPFAVLQLWGFIKPGLKPNERKAVSSIGPWTAILFAVGVGFCWLIIPQAIQWFVGYLNDFPGAHLNQEPGLMVFFVLKMLLAFGLAFQLPLIVYLLGRIGILQPDTLLKYWRHATTVIFILAMIITPSNDPGSMLMMAIPLSLLFIVSVYIVKWTVKPRAQIESDASDGS